MEGIGNYKVGDSDLALPYIEQLDPELWEKLSEARQKLSFVLGSLTASKRLGGMTPELCGALAEDVTEALSLLGINFEAVPPEEPIASRKAEPDA